MSSKGGPGCSSTRSHPGSRSANSNIYTQFITLLSLIPEFSIPPFRKHLCVCILTLYASEQNFFAKLVLLSHLPTIENINFEAAKAPFIEITCMAHIRAKRYLEGYDETTKKPFFVQSMPLLITAVDQGDLIFWDTTEHFKDPMYLEQTDLSLGTFRGFIESIDYDPDSNCLLLKRCDALRFGFMIIFDLDSMTTLFSTALSPSQMQTVFQRGLCLGGGSMWRVQVDPKTQKKSCVQLSNYYLGNWELVALNEPFYVYTNRYGLMVVDMTTDPFSSVHFTPPSVNSLFVHNEAVLVGTENGFIIYDFTQNPNVGALRGEASASFGSSDMFVTFATLQKKRIDLSGEKEDPKRSKSNAMETKPK